MMKKYLPIFISLCFICLSAAGCSDGGMSRNESGGAKTRWYGSRPAEGVDVDLTAMSSIMVYSEVYSIMTQPEKYMGKTIKTSGPYSTGHNDETGENYHFVIVEDATACCRQGLEFMWNGEHVYPDDYPYENAKIEVVGVLKKYGGPGAIYYYLAVDDITVLN